MSVWFVTGASRSFGAVADKLQFVADEQQAWRDLSVSTDHDDLVRRT
jgi:hypothetical protein